jgi:hypothetical protein
VADRRLTVPAGTSVATGFFTVTGAGLLASLLASPRAELGRFFSTLHAVLALGCLLLVVPFRLAGQAAPAGGPGAAGIVAAPAGAALLGAVLAGCIALLFVATLYLPQGRGGRGVLPGGRAGSWMLGLSLACALLAVTVDAWIVAGGRQPAMFVAAAVAAGSLTGVVVVAMDLGHWYLVRTRLSESHLVRFARLIGLAVLLRAVLLVAGMVLFGMESAGGLPSYLRTVAVDRGFFFWQRVLFGLLGPGVLAYMVSETARIRSTQSATGILYVAVIFVLIGELLARYLTVIGLGPM